MHIKSYKAFRSYIFSFFSQLKSFHLYIKRHHLMDGVFNTVTCLERAFNPQLALIGIISVYINVFCIIIFFSFLLSSMSYWDTTACFKALCAAYSDFQKQPTDQTVQDLQRQIDVSSNVLFIYKDGSSDLLNKNPYFVILCFFIFFLYKQLQIRLFY